MYRNKPIPKIFYKRRYRSDSEYGLRTFENESCVTESELASLPINVRRYLIFTGALGKPKIRNFKAVMTGFMKMSVRGKWIKISAEQHNFYPGFARYFYIRSSLFGIPFDGYHRYSGNEATMQIRLAGFFQIVDAKGEKMTRSETVTLFNDMCMFAPSTLLNKSVEWMDENEDSVSARFSNSGFTIRAKLFFGKDGELTDFISEDRFLSSDGKDYISYPWSTPVKVYMEQEGRKIPKYAEAIWHMPGNEYKYARYNLLSIQYNL